MARSVPVDRDAKEFGCYARHGGWRSALLAARNVRSASAGRPRVIPRTPTTPGTHPAPAATPDSVKMTAQQFAKLAGVSRQTVGYYLTAWNLAAKDSLVPHSTTLPVGAAPPLPEADTWPIYYRRARRPPSSTATVTPLHPPSPDPTPASPPAPAPAAQGVLAQLSSAVKASQRAVLGISVLLDHVDDPDLSLDLPTAVARSPLTASQLRQLVEELRQRLPELHQRLETLSDRLDPSVPIPAAAPE